MRRTIDDLLAEARDRIRRLEPQAAADAVAGGAVLVDLRCAEDRNRDGAIPGALRIPRTVLEWRADPSSSSRDERIADLTTHLILMCNEGFSSSLAGANLRDLGFEEVSDVIGGFRAWKEAGMPTTEPTSPRGAR